MGNNTLKCKQSSLTEGFSTAWFNGQVSTVWPPEQREAMWMNTVDAPALIPVIHSAWETSSPLFKYSFQFLVALRPLIDLKKKTKKH